MTTTTTTTTTTKHPPFVIVVLLLAGCMPRAGAAVSPPPPAPIAVRTVAVDWARRTPAVRAVGTLSGKEEVKLSFKTGGLIERLLVDEGARVHAGQTLATLKRREISAGVVQARRGLEKAERDRARVDDLFAGRAATLEQAQNAATAVEVGRAALDAAQFNEAHAIITAPADGIVLRRLAEPDELVAPGAPVLVLRASGRGWIVRAGVTDRDVMRVALGDAATLTLAALPGRSFDAAVSEIAESATPASGTYELELRVDGGGASLRSGLIGQVTIHPRPTTSYAFVPLEALIEGTGDSASVFVPRPDGRAARLSVTLAFLEGDRAAIGRGLEGVTEVVTDGAARLSPNARLEIARAATPAPVRP